MSARASKNYLRQYDGFQRGRRRKMPTVWSWAVTLAVALRLARTAESDAMKSGAGKVLTALQNGGVRGLTQRAARELYYRSGADALAFPLLASDVVLGPVSLPAPSTRPQPGTRLRVGWVCTPPGLGSGGHTTMFRMVEAVERAGHECVLLLYDRFGGDLAEHERVVRQGWPSVKAAVADARHGIRDLHACVATGWDTAHVLAHRGTAPMRRLYFVQDFEPMFYPRGAMYELARATYGFGFRNIALGHMVARELRSDVGVDCDVVPFGCDTATYFLTDPAGSRSGVVFYAKPDVARRGFPLANLALEEFARRRPEQEIHVYGQPLRDNRYPAVHHGRLSPSELNELYNRTITGVAMSFTNITLVAEEMLAAGNIPVVNDSCFARADLPNEHVRWASPTPSAIADQLTRAVTACDLTERAAVAASSVRQGWREAGAGVLAAIEAEVYGTSP